MFLYPCKRWSTPHCWSIAWLERKPRAQLDKTRTGGGSNFAVQRRRQAGCWRVQADQVECIGCLTADLQREPAFKANIAIQPQIDIAVTRRTQIVAGSVAVRSARSDAAGDAGSIRDEGRCIEPFGCSSRAASVRIEECVDSGN